MTIAMISYVDANSSIMYVPWLSYNKQSNLYQLYSGFFMCEIEDDTHSVYLLITYI